MLETLIGHRGTLEKMRVTACDIPQEPLPIGLRITMGIYILILEDGLSVLKSMIEFLEKR